MSQEGRGFVLVGTCIKYLFKEHTTTELRTDRTNPAASISAKRGTTKGSALPTISHPPKGLRLQTRKTKTQIPYHVKEIGRESQVIPHGEVGQLSAAAPEVHSGDIEPIINTFVKHMGNECLIWALIGPEEEGKTARMIAHHSFFCRWRCLCGMRSVLPVDTTIFPLQRRRHSSNQLLRTQYVLMCRRGRERPERDGRSLELVPILGATKNDHRPIP